MRKILLMVSLSVVANSASAEDLLGSSSKTDGGNALYGGVSLGTTNIDLIDDVGVSMSNWKLYGGYEVTPEMAIEGGYHNIASIGNDKAEMKLTGLSVAGVYKVPVGDKLNIFGKAGLMKLDTKATIDTKNINASGSSNLLGAGAVYELSDNWGVRGEYEHLGGDLEASMYSLGAVFSTL